MKDLKITERKRKEMTEPETVGKIDGPNYPWGTRLNLEKDTISKLGLKNVKAGDMVHIEALGKVVEVRTIDRDADKGHENVEIQIQKMDVQPKKKADSKMRDQIGKEVFAD